MNWWHYLLLANLYLALFYGFYLLLLRTETYFILNRIYLVSAAILSFFIPMMQAEWVKNLFITQKVQQTIYYIDPGFVYQVSPAADSGFTISQLFTAVYWLVSMLLLARLIYRFVKLKRYLQAGETNSAFSFFGKVKVDENLPQKDVILQHEMVHVAQLHSADVLLFEALTILNWFNPVIYCYRKAIKYNHEFIADRDAVNFGIDRSDYAMLLLSQSMGVQPNTLTNSFFNQSLLKQRIMMLHKNPSRRTALLKYGLSAPLFVVMLILTSATVSEQKTIKIISDKISSDATVKEVASDFENEITASAKITSTKKGVVKTASDLKGKVVNLNGVPLIGVKITYPKNNFSITSNQEGDFKIPNYKENDPVNFNYNRDGGYVLVKTFSNIKDQLKIVVLQLNSGVGKVQAFTNVTANKNFTNVTVNKNSETTGEPVSFANVEKLPMFPGGEKTFGEFLAKAIRYPKVAKDKNMQGRVIISFIVETDGSLTNIKVLRDIGGGCGPEAIRVLSESPKWIPGTQKGEPVRVAYTMPINFTLAGDDKQKADSTAGKFPPSKVYYLNPLDTTKTTRVTTLDDMPRASQPLYIIDGVEIKGSGGIKNVSPNDIESITVLKDANGTAKYGDKGKNGVILITTKKGKKAAETTKP